MGVYTNTKRFYDVVGNIARTKSNMTLDDYTKYQSNLKDGKYNLLGDIFVQNLVSQFSTYFKTINSKAVPGTLTFNEILNCKTKALKNTYSSCSDNYFSVIDTVLEDTDNFFKYKNMFGNSMESRTWSNLADNYGCCGGVKQAVEFGGGQKEVV